MRIFGDEEKIWIARKFRITDNSFAFGRRLVFLGQSLKQLRLINRCRLAVKEKGHRNDIQFCNFSTVTHKINNLIHHADLVYIA